jgi:catechol 2,3-dioxygenase-like lactoylglutathione lyase family enzyme
VFRGVHHVAVNTSDLERAVAFYRDAFGFLPVGPEHRWANDPNTELTTGVRGSAARTILLKAGNCYLEVFEYSAPPPRAGGALRANDRGYTHIGIEVSEIEAELKRLSQLGMTFANPEAVDHGTTKAVYGWDLDGNIIEIMECMPDAPFGIEKLHGG